MIHKGIESFIAKQIRLHPQLSYGPLAEWTPEHETQIITNTSGLEKVHGRNVFTKDGLVFHSDIRIPYTNKFTGLHSFYDRQVHGNIYARWELIGTTGWNWEQGRSMWVGYDFDCADGHVKGHARQALAETIAAAKSLDYVQPRTSKSGTGYHLLVRLDPWKETPTRQHHIALAKAVLQQMCKDANYDFTITLDKDFVQGGLLWHWSKGLTTNGCKQF